MTNGLGKKFCSFYTERLRKEFRKFPEGVKLGINEGAIPENGFVCIGNRTEWQDARYTAEEKKISARWIFWGEYRDKAVQYFLEMILEELEKRFGNVLYLEVLENQMEVYKNPCEIRLLQAILGEMLKREWLIAQFVKRILNEKELPSLEFLIQISAQKYERRTVKSRIYFEYLRENGDLEFVREKDEKEWQLVPENLRAIRKIMEMAGNFNGLYVGKENGIYNIKGIVSKKDGEFPAICIAFTGHLSWEVLENNQVLFEYRDGLCRIPALDGEKDEGEWKEELLCLIRKKTDLHIDEKVITNLVNMLKEQKHGTSIVFMEQDILKWEKERLTEYKRGYQWEPFPLIENKDEGQNKCENKVLGISAVDGAIIADLNGRCHLAGAILDGEAVIPGRADRGARYNSLLNYVNWAYEKYEKDYLCFAFVLSEDGTIDLVVPNDCAIKFRCDNSG